MGDDVTHYCSKCPAFSRYVTVHVKRDEGEFNLYASGKVMNPGPLSNASLLYKDESMNNDSKSLTVDVDDLTKVYANVIGG